MSTGVFFSSTKTHLSRPKKARKYSTPTTGAKDKKNTSKNVPFLLILWRNKSSRGNNNDCRSSESPKSSERGKKLCFFYVQATPRPCTRKQEKLPFWGRERCVFVFLCSKKCLWTHSNTKSSILYNLVNVGGASWVILDELLDNRTVKKCMF